MEKDTNITYRQSRLECGEAYMMCNECGARLYSFDGTEDKSRNCPYKQSMYDKCDPPHRGY